jgi:sulfite reductase alpha subunit-like flavoprotein
MRDVQQPEEKSMAAMASNECRDPRTVLVAYATETGNSQDVAEDLGGLAERLHFKTRVCELDAVKAVRMANE